ncbi:protein kinase, partial [Planctomycetota bacterium]
DGKASRNHAVIFTKGDQVFIRDLGSKNGVFLDGEQVTEKEIPFGSNITIGDTNLVLEDAIDESELIGNRLGAYRVIELVGKGGMGVVFKANQLSLDRIVALKVLNRSLVSRKGFVDRFVKEARAAGNLNHPNLIQVHDFGQEGEDYWFSMEFVEGATVSQILRKNGKMPERLAIHVIKEVAKALEYAHSRNLVHRDIKPSNIMIDAEGNVKLADLGIAETLHNIETEGKKVSVMGTPEYMSPEQAKGKVVDPRSDIYSLGASLFHMITGRAPFKGRRTRETVKMVANDDPPPVRELLPDASHQLVRFLQQVMERDPEKRIANAKDLISSIDDRWHTSPEQDHNRQKSLVDFMKGVVKSKHSSLSSYARSRPRQVLWMGVAGTVGLVLTIAGIVYLTNRKDIPPLPVPPAPRPGPRVVGDDPPKVKRPIPEPKPVETPEEKERKKFLAQARKAYEEAEAYEEDHGDDLDGRWRRWRDYLTKYGGTPDADKVRQRIEKVDQEMKQASVDSFKVAIADADIQAEKGGYFAAITTVQKYTRGSYSPEIKRKAETLIQKYRQGYHSAFNRAKKTADNGLQMGRYADAIHAYQSFIDTAGGGPKAAEAKSLMEAAQKKMTGDYAKALERITACVDRFDFSAAETELQDLSEKFENTLVLTQVKGTEEAVRRLKQLHSMVIQKIRVTEPPKILPFAIGKVGRGKATSATEDRLSINFGEIQQDLLWTKFTKEQVFQIYRMYLDERLKKNRSFLASFAKQFRIKSRYYQP